MWKFAITSIIPKPRQISIWEQAPSSDPSCFYALLILPTVTSFLRVEGTQRRSLHSLRYTFSAHLPLATRTATGMNYWRPPQCTVVSVVDSAAFGTVSRYGLVDLIRCSNLSNNFIRYLASCLHGNWEHVYNHSTYHSSVTLRGSSTRVCYCTLFLQSICELLYPQSGLLISSYADDFTAAASSSDYRAVPAILTDHASIVAEWAGASLCVYHEVTLHPFHLCHSSVTYGLLEDNSVQRHHKILGVIFDTVHLHFSYPLHQQAMYFSAPHPEDALRCSVRAEEGNSCHFPCSHSLPYPLCVASLFFLMLPVQQYNGCKMPACVQLALYKWP